jgi:hypothetical protein
MSLLIIIPYTTCLWFVALYPFFVWVNKGEKICPSFYQFNMGICTVILSGAMFYTLFSGVAISKLLIPWFILILFATALVWGRESISPWIPTVPACFGFYVCLDLLNTTPLSIMHNSVIVIGVLIVTGAIFTGVLGHWYLNVAGLPLKYLMRGTFFYTTLILLRLIYDAFIIFKGHILYKGDQLLVKDFLWSFEGSMVILGLFFSCLVPLFMSGMVIHIIRLKNTQAATGVLYVVVASLLMGDLFYKYLFFHYKLVM